MDVKELIANKRKEVADLEHQLEIQRAVLEELLRLNGSASRPAKANPRLRKKAKPAPHKRGRRGKPDSVPSRIYELFIREDRAMTSVEITRTLEAAGVTTESKHGLGLIVSSALSRDKRFERVGVGRYRLKKESSA